MPFHQEKRTSSIEAQQIVERAPGTEQFVIPRDIETNVNTRNVNTVLGSGGPLVPEPGTTVFASGGSTRWTKGRGNKPFHRRAAGVVAGALITLPVMAGRGIIYGLQGAADGAREGAKWATGILKNQHPLVWIVGVPLLVIPSIAVGGIVGGAYHAGRGVVTAAADAWKGILSSASGGDANYLAIASRKYRD